MTHAPHWTARLRELRACSEAIAWAAAYPTAEEAWAACERGDWMLWWLDKTTTGQKGSPSRRKLVLAACACARLALPHVADEDARRKATEAIDDAECWARQECGHVQAGWAARDAWAATKATLVAAETASGAKDAMAKDGADIVRRFYPNPPAQA